MHTILPLSMDRERGAARRNNSHRKDRRKGERKHMNANLHTNQLT